MKNNFGKLFFSLLKFKDRQQQIMFDDDNKSEKTLNYLHNNILVDFFSVFFFFCYGNFSST